MAGVHPTIAGNRHAVAPLYPPRQGTMAGSFPLQKAPPLAPAQLDTSQLDLDAYLARVGHRGPLDARHETLEALHRAHATGIPFENLDVLLGRPVRLDLPSIQAKLVTGGRGGYCYEQNTLFGTVLTAIGFQVTPLAARVRYNTTAVRPRTHMVLKVADEAGDWLADVGFGAGGMFAPAPFDGGDSRRHSPWVQRLEREDGQWVLRARAADRPGAWQDLYAFTLEPQLPVDYEMANHFTSTHPNSPFVRGPYVQRATTHGRHVLFGRELTWDTGAETTTRTLADHTELLKVLAETFGLAFPPDTRFALVEER